MFIYRLSEAPIRPTDIVFRTRPPFGFLTVMLIIETLPVYGIIQNHLTNGFWTGGTLILYGSALFGAFMIFLLLWTIRHTRRPENWLVRFDGSRLLIKYRSYLNAHFSPDDPQVFSQREEIAWIRPVKETRKQQGGDGQETGFLRYIDIQTQNTDTRVLEALLLAELTRQPPNAGKKFTVTTKHNDVPIHLIDETIVRICWMSLSGTITPGLKRTMAILNSHFPTRELLKIKTDLTVSCGNSTTENDEKIRALLLSGDRIGAISLARTAYNLSLTQAHTYVDNLIAPQAGAATSLPTSFKS